MTVHTLTLPIYLRSASGLHAATYPLPGRQDGAANFPIFTEMRNQGVLLRRNMLKFSR